MNLIYVNREFLPFFKRYILNKKSTNIYLSIYIYIYLYIPLCMSIFIYLSI